MMERMEGSLEKNNPLLLQCLTLLKYRLHFLHVAGTAAIQLLQGLLIALTHLLKGVKNQRDPCLMESRPVDYFLSTMI